MPHNPRSTLSGRYQAALDPDIPIDGLGDLTKRVLEAGLEVEMDDYVGYAKHNVEGRNRG